MKILFNYASRSRPQNFFRGLDSIVLNIYDKDLFHVVCSLDSDDPEMNNGNVIKKLSEYKNVSYYFGKSKNKIDAINREISNFPDFDILINFSDDMIFTKKHFDQILRGAMMAYFPDLDGFLHFNDSNQKRTSTMTVEGRKYFDRFGFIYHPEYISLFCDNEAQDIAQRLDKYKYVGDSIKIFTHIHPSFGRVRVDEQYKHTQSFYQVDRLTYLARLKKNFYL